MVYVFYSDESKFAGAHAIKDYGNFCPCTRRKRFIKSNFFGFRLSVYRGSLFIERPQSMVAFKPGRNAKLIAHLVAW